MARQLLQIGKWLLILQVGYLLLLNGALRLPLTQDIVNLIRPEKFYVSWERAWTWYPFRVHAEGIFANGQSRNQQWQLQADSASASIRLLPLVAKRVWLRDIDATNLDYRQRPRLKAGRDYSKALPFFPEIRGRDIIEADPNPLPKRRPWHIRIRNMQASGEHSIWIYQLQGSASGTMAAHLDVATRGGEFSMDGYHLDLVLGETSLQGIESLVTGGRISGSLGFAPFVPRENKGLAMLPFVLADTEVDVYMDSLRFMNLFTSNLGSLLIDGAGQVQGRLHYEKGYLMPGTDLGVGADNIDVRFRGLAVSGEGEIEVSVAERELNPMTLSIDYEDLAIQREADEEPFVIGDSLALAIQGSNYAAPEPGLSFKELMEDEEARARRASARMTIDISSAALTDLGIINDYLPPEIPLRIRGGRADLEADIDSGPGDSEGKVKLSSSDLQLDYDGQLLEGTLEAELLLSGGTFSDLEFDFDGSTLVLDEVRVSGDRENFAEQGWSAKIDVLAAKARWQTPPRLNAELGLRISDTRPVVAIFENQGYRPAWLSRMLTIEDIEGSATLAMADNRFTIPDAHAEGDKLELGAKGVFTPDHRDGVIYVRYQKLAALLKIQGEKNNLDVLKTREKFENYRVPAL